jgi:type II secretory pathway pseudopilin PulG
MKKVIISVLIGLIVGGGAVYLILHFQKGGPAPATVDSAVKNSFTEVTSKLDGGGELYLYVSTERVVNYVEDFAAKLRKIVAANVDESRPETMSGLKIFDFVYGMIKDSGLMEISGLGMSSVAVDETLNRSKFVLHHYKGEGKGLIWQMMEETPHELEGLKLLPADTVLASFSDFRIQALWQWFKGEVDKSDLPPLKKAVPSIEPMLLKQGLDLNKLLDSMAGRVGFILSLDSKNMKTIPAGNITIEIPDPAIAIVFIVKDAYIFDLLQSKMPFAPPSEEGGMKKIQIPVPPMPITVAPTIVQKDDLLIIASNNQIVEAMMAAADKGDGLTATDEFKKLSKGIPSKGNHFRFLSARFFQLILDIQKKAMAAAGTMKAEDSAAKELFDLFPQKLAFYGVQQNSAEGQIFTFNHTLKMEHLVLLPFTAVVGVVAAIAVPNFLTAMQKGKQKATMGDMKSIAMAVESYITDKGYAPKGKTLEELKAELEPFYIKTLPLKDGWGNDLVYYHGSGAKQDEYAVGSGGKDGIFDGWEQTGFYHVTSIQDFNRDIIFANGTFTLGPEVK